MRTGRRKLGAWALIAATYFIVSGGPYGLEDLVSSAGYAGALAILVLTPLVWSLPTALMVGELAARLPEQGGYYAWVRRALGPFWGFQEGWLSLAASFFDMAIYPTLFVAYLGKLFPGLGSGPAAAAMGIGLIVVCAGWNILGAQAVGRGALVFGAMLLLPFLMLMGKGWLHPAAAPAGGLPAGGLLAGLLVAMWNYMGWDNAATFPQEVERPQRIFPLAMLVTVGLVTATYGLPVAAAWRSGIPAASFSTGAWVSVGARMGGVWLARLLVVGGALSAIGMFNTLVLSYSNVAVALARDGYLPRWLTRVHPKSGAPWAAIAACAVVYAGCLALNFARLIELDVVLYGLSLVLEFAALIRLRLSDGSGSPTFRIPGGSVGLVAVTVFPCALVALSVVEGLREAQSFQGVMAGALLALLGLPLYGLTRRFAKPATPGV